MADNQLSSIIAEVENLLRENMEFVEHAQKFWIRSDPEFKQAEYLIRKNRMYMGLSEDE